MPATVLQPIKIRNLMIYGVIRTAEVDDYLIPDGAVVEAVNVHGDRKGAVTLRPGITAIGSQISSGYSCLGLYNALFSNASYNGLLAVFSTGASNNIYSSTGSSWSVSHSGDTAGAKTRFATFSDRAIKVNGSNVMAQWAGIGSNWSTSGNPINPDDLTGYATKFVEVYKSRVYTAGDSSYPDRLLYSSVISSSGNITWTPANDFVDINPNDGENISALKRFSLELLIFKPNYIYRFRTTETDPDPLIKIGTRSQESIVEGKKGLYFHHDTGFYRYSGGYPQEISRPISDIIQAIPLSYYDDISSWKDDDHIYWSVGDLTIAGETWSNVVARYTESSDVWTVYSYGTEIMWGSDFNDGSTLKRVVGDNNGYVFTFNSGTTDNTTAISYRMITKWYELGNIAERKIIQQMITICEKAQGTKVQYQIDNDPAWYNLGVLTKYLNYYKPLSIKFHRIRFKLFGMSSVEAFIFQGFEIVEGIVEGLIEEK